MVSKRELLDRLEQARAERENLRNERIEAEAELVEVKYERNRLQRRLEAALNRGKKVYAIAVAKDVEFHYASLLDGGRRRSVGNWVIHHAESSDRRYIEARFNHLLATDQLPKDAEIIERTEYVSDWKVAE